VLAETGAGIASEPGNAAALAQSVESLAAMSGDERARMGAAGTEYVSTHFHRGRLAASYLELLREAAAEGRR
jgi:glycosyltransferase involved in cell wall biosynthesis